jgi:hypothetical protein
MNVGTKSVLFGAHQFLIHPFFVAIAWWKLYGFPLDPRLWLAFFLHDLGYVGKPNMDGSEGEQHPYFGAILMGIFFGIEWYDFCLFHSRFMAKRHGMNYSRLCVADKLAVSIEPWWLYLPRVILSGEIKEYMRIGSSRESKYDGEPGQEYTKALKADGSKRGWFKACSWYLDQWAYEHRNLKVDIWTRI